MKRTLVITDIHGKKEKAEEMLNKLNYKDEDTLVVLGDYVDRGEDSKGVIDLLIDLSNKGDVVCLLGNHDDWFRRFLNDEMDFEETLIWLFNGGYETLNNYCSEIEDEEFSKGLLVLKLFSNWYIDEGRMVYASLSNEDYFSDFGDINKVMFELLCHRFDMYDVMSGLKAWEKSRDFIVDNYKSHVDFLMNLKWYYEDENYYYTHGGCNLFKKTLSENELDELIWPNRKLFYTNDLNLDKPVIVGHTVVTYIPNHGILEVYVSKSGDKIGIDGGIVFGFKMFGLIIEDETGKYDIVEIR